MDGSHFYTLSAGIVRELTLTAFGIIAASLFSWIMIIVIIVRATNAARDDIGALCHVLGNYADARSQFVIRERVMGDVSTSFRQFGDICIIEPDHMYQDRPGSQQTNVLSIEHWGESEFFLQVDFIGFDRGQVHGDTHISLSSQLTHFIAQHRSDTCGGTWTEANMDTLIGGTLPLAMYVQDIQQAALPAFTHARMHRVILCHVDSSIHDDVSQVGQHTSFLNDPGNIVEALPMR